MLLGQALELPLMVKGKSASGEGLRVTGSDVQTVPVKV